MLVASVALLLGASLTGCSSDSSLNPQFQEPVSAAATDSGVLEDEYLNLEALADDGSSFSRYGIGIDNHDDAGGYSSNIGDFYWVKDDSGLVRP